jgi:hypothetical protein
MKRFFKIILIIFLTIFVTIGLVVTCTGFALKKGVENIAEKAMDAGPQNEEITAQGVIITKSLTTKDVILFKGVEWCKLDNAPKFNYSYSSVCTNGNCTTTIDMDNKPIPQDMIIYRKYNGICVSQTIPDVKKYAAVFYIGNINISPALAEKLHLSVDKNVKLEKTAQSKFVDYGNIRINNNITFNLNYGTVKPASDEFLFGSKLIKITYNN